MAAADVLKSAGSNVLGKLGYVAKARIEIIDVRKRDTVTEQPPTAAGGGGGGLGGMPSLPTIPVENIAGTLAMAMPNILSEDAAKKPSLPANAVVRSFEVQFNPNELEFSGSGGEFKEVKDVSTQQQNGTYETTKAKITMNVTLIFNKVDSADAFMSDRLNLAPTALAANAVKAGLALAGKSNRSVQTEVEGFLGAVRSPETNMIRFYWGDMFYQGVLTNVSAEYKMFNLKGDPIHAEVKLSITCTDEKISPGSMGMWQSAFNNAFAVSSSYAKTAQKVGNLLNFNL